jgi:LmbE family N-acetylglucosaminyl deacetylase
MRSSWQAILILWLVAGCASPVEQPVDGTTTAGPLHPAPGRPRILAVIAHPDDETTFAGTLYKCASFLGATCDIVVITNGEGGYKYSTLAEPLYRLELTQEAVGRANLPGIRQHEMKEACALIGVHDIKFLRQPDHRFTLDEGEILDKGAQVWNLELVLTHLRQRIHEQGYDFVLTLLPTPGTHGHHKAATLLALEAIASLPRPDRPVPLGVGVYDHDDPPEAFRMLDGWPLSTLDPDGEAFVFDRTQSFGYADRLDYRIVVNWVIAAHKSQGTMQLAAGKGEEERFFLYGLASADATERTRALFSRLAERQFPSTPEAGEGAARTDAGRASAGTATVPASSH